MSTDRGSSGSRSGDDHDHDHHHDHDHDHDPDHAGAPAHPHPTDVRLRRATPDDLEILLELNAEYCEADGHPVDVETARRGLVPLIADDRHGGVWLIVTGTTDADRVEGYLVLAWSWSVEIGGAEAVLDEVYVRRRGLGIGGRAVLAAIDECRGAGMRRVVLETERPNERARQLYRRLGFDEDDSIWMSSMVD